ncbi:21394_t:CDS:2 [Dentiscutata erythropus]|uniref:21394_t:CDS:1 n=1 Tax=Dentiscutata erythropus TaxID=1348616 RepID=A0A9N9F9Q4_9GLOM|nr:21394_t:CDS:2 [Dentiscutata erythropus]
MNGFISPNIFAVLANDSEDDQQSEASETKTEISKDTYVNGCTKRSKPDYESNRSWESYSKKQRIKINTERSTRNDNDKKLTANPISTNRLIPPVPDTNTSTTLPSQEDHFGKQIHENLKFSMGQRPSSFGDSFNTFVRFKNPISLIVKRCYRIYEFVTKGTDNSAHYFGNADDNTCPNTICQRCSLLDRCDININRHSTIPLTPLKENKITSRRSKQYSKRNVEIFGEQLDPSDLLKGYNNPKSDSVNNSIPRNGPTLFISFGCSEIKYSIEEFYKFGFHPIYKSFAKYTNVEILRKFVLNCAVNCWANAWRIVVVILSNSNINIDYISLFVKELRNVCDQLVLDIIVIHTFLGCVGTEKDKRFIEKSGTSAVIYRHADFDLYLLQDSLNYFGEPYYEFTNFFLVPVKIDDLDWPSTENYFQAQKFHNRYLQETIRKAWSAREAFVIARRNDCYKRRDWEEYQAPKGIFKECVMRKALLAKFRQHEKLKYKLLSTSTALLYEHTENDKYWGDGGKFGKGLNRLGYFLMDVRNQLMQDEIDLLAYEYIGHNEKWIMNELRELNKLG